MITVGQRLWFVYEDHRRGEPREITVIKVGRKWAQLSNYYRIDINTMVVDGGVYPSPGKCYESQKHYEYCCAANKLWDATRNGMRYVVPVGVTLNDIKQARKLLGLEDVDG